MKNLIYILVDALSYDNVGKREYRQSPTAFLDELKEQSLSYENMYTQAPYTEAAFVSTVCGENVLDHGGYLLKLAMSGMLDMEAAGAKEVMDRGYLTLFFAYLNLLCARKEYLFSEERTITHPLVDEISNYIDAHMGESISVEDLAKLVHMSKYHFLRKFKDITGVTVHTFLTNKRLIKACELLKNGKNITQAYQSCGFSDYSAFLRNFKKTFGVSPGKYLDFH